MSFHDLITSLTGDTERSLRLFLPELTLCVTIVVMLLVRVFRGGRRVSGLLLALVGSGVGLYFALLPMPQAIAGDLAAAEIFTGLVRYDSLTVFLRSLLLGFAVLFCLLSWLTGLPDNEDSPDYFTLVLGATLGMCLMASANHLLMVFLAVEMASVPSYVLAGILKGRRRASEAALKYAVFGAGAAGVMLYGISLLVGITGSAHLPTLAQQLIRMDLPHLPGEELRVLALGGLMLMVGLAFKLSAVPFHFWCPDVFEGATAEVNAFLSVASKAAALGLLVRVAVAFSHAPPPEVAVMDAAALGNPNGPLTPVALTISEPLAAVDEDLAAKGADDEAKLRHFLDLSQLRAPLVASPYLQPARTFIVNLLALVAVITCTLGNLAAFGQNNIKRMLAYSTIAHAGYMIMPVAAAVAAMGTDLELARSALKAVVFYIAVYLWMNLGAFAIVAFLRNAARTEDIRDYAGLIRSCPWTVICFSLILVSLIGLPPLAGFAGKLTIFEALFNAGGPVMMTLLVVASVNTVFSLVYYLRVIKVMTMDPEPDSRGPVHLGFLSVAYITAVTAPVVVLGLFFNELRTLSERVVAIF